MKIALAILRTTLGVVGPSTVDNLAQGLQKLGAEVILLTAKTSAKPSYKKIHYAPFSWSLAKLPLCLIYFIKNVRRISKQVDIVQVYLPSPAFAFVGDIISFKNRAPIIVVFESSLIENYRIIMPFFKQSPLFYLSRILINNSLIGKFTKFSCCKYIVSSEYQKNQLLLLGYPEEKIGVTPNSIDINKYIRCDTTALRNKFGLSNKIIGYLGHFTHNKGADLLIKAFKDILEKIPNAKLVLAWSELSSGKRQVERKIKKERLEEKTIILGKVNTPKFLSALDILVLPYRVTFATQLFPSTLLEAMSVGVPLITTNIRPLDEIVEDGNTALVVPSGNPQKIAEAVINLLSDRELREKMVINQRKIARQKFSQENITKKYLELYKKIKNG
ncbi:MAG: glycosyltransferase family 4 protein [Patescibacteria group bacterium]